ncbi:MAG TPA: hypothetical protein VE755_06065 [Myxococcales bacterium]|jgi:hypothetical protein|nr:hypothetical protein [Myxococcales bacterium]
MTDRQRQLHEHLDRPVSGADLPPHERPGVPMEHETRPLTPTAPEHIEHMRPRRGLTHRKELRSMTPVFSTAQPLHGISGLLRRAAYSTRETQAKHWMMLLLADRVNVLEHRVAKLVKIIAIVPAGAAALVLAVKFLKD